MPWTFAKVHAFVQTLDGVSVGTRWGHRTWLVGATGFAWERPLGKADVKRYPSSPVPTGELLAVRTENLDAKDALLSMELPGLFTIEHFKNYPAVLFELRRARAADVRAALAEAYRAASRPRR